MKKSLLALLSSSTLFVTFLLLGLPAQANNSNSANQNIDTTVVITRTDSTADLNTQSLDDRMNILTSDRIGDLAIQKFGCDCMGCRQAALSIVSK